MEIIYNFWNSLLYSFSEMSIWLKFIIFLMISLLLYKLLLQNQKENFENTKEFIVKNSENMYDDFYVGIYEQLFFKSFSNSFEVGNIINHTNPSSESIILQIGSKTGNTIEQLRKKNLPAIGTDIHNEFVNISSKNFPKCSFQQANPLNKISFRDNSFTHILCLDLTLYTIQNKSMFIKNCFEWLMPGGFFVCNLVDKNKFDTMVPASNPLFLVNPQSYSKERITKSSVVFDDFTYKSDFNKINKNVFEFEELFIYPHHIRKQSETYYMPNKESIIGTAKEQGFIVYAQIDLTKGQKENQYIYIFLKPE